MNLRERSWEKSVKNRLRNKIFGWDAESCVLVRKVSGAEIRSVRCEWADVHLGRSSFIGGHGSIIHGVSQHREHSTAHGTGHWRRRRRRRRLDPPHWLRLRSGHRPPDGTCAHNTILPGLPLSRSTQRSRLSPLPFTNSPTLSPLFYSRTAASNPRIRLQISRKSSRRKSYGEESYTHVSTLKTYFLRQNLKDIGYHTSGLETRGEITSASIIFNQKQTCFGPINSKKLLEKLKNVIKLKITVTYLKNGKRY